MRCDPLALNPPPDLATRGRTVLLRASTAGALLLSLATAAAPLPYCDPSITSCLVTTEIFVELPVPHRLEVPLASSMVLAGGSPEWTDEEGLLMAPCGQGMSCYATLTQEDLTVEDQCDGGVSLFSLSGNRPDYTCGTDCDTTTDIVASGNTWAARTAYFWAQQAILKARSYVDADEIPTVNLQTNHNADTHASGANLICAGFWDDANATISLFRSGGGCANTGENASIVAHEWAHALYSGLLDPLVAQPIDETTDEAQADVHAALVTEDLCIGRGVRPGERCAGCRESCNGLRDLGAFSLSSGDPVTAATIFDPDGLDCPTGDGPLGAAPHCESLIASTAFMDMAAMLRSRHGEEIGVTLAEALYYDSLPRLSSVYQVVDGETDGCHAGSWYNALLAADDARNGDDHPANGTPNACLIFQAFDAHDIACGALPTGCPPWVDAGDDRQVCVGKPVSIGPPQPPDLDITWSHGAEGTPISVTPQAAGLETYGLQVLDASGAISSQDTIAIRAYGCSESFSDNFDSGPLANWEMTGLWHHAANPACPDSYAPHPPLLLASPAMYFGLDTCHYETCRGAVFGDLISDVIAVPATSPTGYLPALSFSSQRGVESYPGPVTTDRTEVWIEEWPTTPTSTADLRWARSSATAEPACVPGADPPLGCPSQIYPLQADDVPPISLEPYAGKHIRVRFHFDSLDVKHNRYIGWLVDDVTVSQIAEEEIPTGDPPTLTLISPAEGDVLPCCQCETFEIFAEDSFGNDLSDQVIWSSDINGELGSGRGISMILSPNQPAGTPPSPDDDRKPHHTITASVIDRAGQRGSINFQLTVPDDGQECALLALTSAELRRDCTGDVDR